MAVSAFLRVDGIAGDAQLLNFKGQIQLTGFQISVESEMQTGAVSSGAGAGKVKFNALTVTKVQDSASSPIFLACCAGTHAATATLSLVNAGDANAYLKIDLNPIAFTSFATALSNGVTIETVTLVYSALKFTYLTQGPTGIMNPVNTYGWSEITNTKL